MKKAHPLLQLHDTDLMLASLRDAESVSRLKRLGLECDEVETLERARGRLVRQVEPHWVTPYERALGRYGRCRPVQSLVSGVC